MNVICLRVCSKRNAKWQQFVSLFFRATERTALTDAAARGHIVGLRFLLEELGADPHVSCDCHLGHRHTALHYAAERADTAAMELLLKQGSNPHILSEQGRTAAQLLPQNAPAQARLLISAASATAGEQIPVIPLQKPKPHRARQKEFDQNK